MRVAVVGAGSIGASLAALLAEAGRDVTLVARGEALARWSASPIRLEGPDGRERPVRVPVVAAVPDADVYVVATKMHDVESAVAPLGKREGAIVLMQNGVRSEEIASRVAPAERLVGCVTSFDAVAEREGAVRIGRIGGLTLGSPLGPVNGAVRAAAAALAPAMPVATTTSLAGARWTKLIVNLNNAIPAATGLSIQGAYADARLARLAARALAEGAAVARAEGVRLAPTPWARPALVRALAALPTPLAARLLARRVRAVLGERPAYASTYESVKRGERTEIDWLNGEIVERGRRRRMRVPVNAALLRAVRDAGARRAFWPVERLLREVRPED